MHWQWWCIATQCNAMKSIFLQCDCALAVVVVLCGVLSSSWGTTLRFPTATVSCSLPAAAMFLQTFFPIKLFLEGNPSPDQKQIQMQFGKQIQIQLRIKSRGSLPFFPLAIFGFSPGHSLQQSVSSLNILQAFFLIKLFRRKSKFQIE